MCFISFYSHFHIDTAFPLPQTIFQLLFQPSLPEDSRPHYDPYQHHLLKISKFELPATYSLTLLEVGDS
jgi:hypothetical protein